MAIVEDWVQAAAEAVLKDMVVGPADMYHQQAVDRIAAVISKHCPFKPDVAYEEVVHREPPLLQCADCKNTESPAGAMARFFNNGRCLHCGGYFKVIRA